MKLAGLLLLLLTGCSIHVRNCICTRKEPDRFRCICVEHQVVDPTKTAPCPTKEKPDEKSPGHSNPTRLEAGGVLSRMR